MRRDVLLLEEMIQAAVQAVALVEGGRGRRPGCRSDSPRRAVCGTSPCSAKPLRSCRMS